MYGWGCNKAEARELSKSQIMKACECHAKELGVYLGKVVGKHRKALPRRAH